MADLLDETNPTPDEESAEALAAFEQAFEHAGTGSAVAPETLPPSTVEMLKENTVPEPETVDESQEPAPSGQSLSTSDTPDQASVEESQTEPSSEEENPFEKRIRAMEGKFGNILQERELQQRRIEELENRLAQQGNTPANIQQGQELAQQQQQVNQDIEALFGSEEFKELKELQPETFNALKLLIDKQSALQTQAQPQQTEADPAAEYNRFVFEQTKEAAFNRVKTKYPNYAQMVNEPAFHGWLDLQDDQTKTDALMYDGDKWIALLDKYTGKRVQYNNNTQGNETNNQVLTDAVPPTNRPSSVAQNVTDIGDELAAEEAAFNSVFET